MTSTTVEFQVPSDFVPFEPAENLENAYELVLARLGPAAHGLPAARRQAITELYAAGSTALTEAGVIWSGTCVGTIGDRLSTATLTLTALDTEDETPQAIAATGLVEILTPPKNTPSNQPQCLVSRFDAPAGPVVITLEQNPGWQITADETIPLLSAKAYLPMPPALHGVLIIELSTPDTDNWQTVYAPLLVRIVRGIRFPEAEQPGTHPHEQPVSDVPAPRPPDDPFGTRLSR